MKNWTQKFSRIFTQYLLSYAGVVILACAAIGMTLFFVASGNLEQTQLNNEQERLKFAISDLDRQYDIIKNISISIAQQSYYKSYYAERSAMDRINLVEDLKRYEDRSPLIDDFFFYRRNDNLIYMPGATNNINIYAKYVLMLNDPEALRNELASVNDITLFRLSNSEVLLLFPINTENARKDQITAVVGFRISSAAFFTRLEQVAGRSEFPTAFFFGDAVLFSSADDVSYIPSQLKFDANDTLIQSPGKLGAQSANTKFTAIMDSTNINRNLQPFRYFCITIIFAVVAASLLLSLLMAKINYSPIRRLARKYDATSDKNEADELQAIDEALERATTQRTLTERQLREQFTMLNVQKSVLTQQFFQLTLNGEMQDPEGLQRLGLDFSNPYYCVFLIYADGLSPTEKDALLPMINELSSDSLKLACVDMGSENVLIVVANALNESQFQIARETIGAVGNTRNLNLSIKAGSVVDDIHSISLSYIAAGMSGHGGADAQPYDDSLAPQLISALKGGNLPLALEKVEAIKNMLGMLSGLSPIYIKYATSDISIDIMHAFSDISAPTLIEKAGRLLYTNDSNEYYENLKSLVEYIYALLSQQKHVEREETMRGVMDYVRANAFESQLDYAMLVEKFGLSAKVLRGIIKDATGKSLREYLNSLRIEKACELLKSSDKSVTEIADEVGYMSVSYFIMNFRTMTGITPIEFRTCR